MKIVVCNNIKSNLAKDIFDELKLDRKIDIKYIENNDKNLIIDSVIGCDVIFWFNNDFSIKKVVPTSLIIGYQELKFPFVDMLNKSLIRRDNLTIASNNSNHLLYDPLGTKWYDGTQTLSLIRSLMERVNFLLKTHRERTYQVDEEFEIPMNEDFFEYVREVGEIFHKTVQHTDGVTRLMGNASFRGIDGIIYTSERDMDKSLITREHFVPCILGNDGKTYYSGSVKPSKDTVVQMQFYKKFKNINYIVHCHCYVKGAPFTKLPVPCGSLEEISEVMDVIDDKYNSNYEKEYYAINLIGHGCLVFGSNLDFMRQAEYLTRQLPEALKTANNGEFIEPKL